MNFIEMMAKTARAAISSITEARPKKTKLVAPVRSPVTITSPYGPRVLNGKKQNHNGVDYVNGNSDANYHRDKSVVAMCDGVCIYDFDSYDDGKRWTDPTHSAGNMVVLEHMIDGVLKYIRYLHLSSNCIKVGQTVKRGEKIGEYADVGQSFGDHTHCDLWSAEWANLDPTDVFPKA